MSMKLNKEAYIGLIKDDINRLENIPDCLERDHIEAVLRESVNFYYPDNTRPVQEVKCINCDYNKPDNAICDFCYNYNKHSYNHKDRPLQMVKTKTIELAESKNK